MSCKSSLVSFATVFALWLGIILGCGGTPQNRQGGSSSASSSSSSSPSPSASPIPITAQPHSQQASNSNSQAAAIKPVVDIPQLISKSPAELDKVLGRAIRITKITNDPEMMPGEYRDYKIENSIGTLTEDGLWVRFYRGKADHFTVDLPHLAHTGEAALLMVGIDVKGAGAKVKAPLAALDWQFQRN